MKAGFTLPNVIRNENKGIQVVQSLVMLTIAFAFENTQYIILA